MPETPPRVFVGSSAEGLPIAREFQAALEDIADCEVSVWDQGTFVPSTYTTESLLRATRAADFAVLVATPDDVTESRGTSAASPRDNVIFELGLFMGALGVERVFILRPAGETRLPSDLAGLTHLPPYNSARADGNLRAALNSPALAATRAMRALGPRSRGFPAALTPQVDEPVAGHQAALAAEIDLICKSATAQGWRIRARSDTTLRLMNPSGKKITYTIPLNHLEAREGLRGFARLLRASGLRVNHRLREPVAPR